MMAVLMYHDIVSGTENASGFPGRDAALYKVTLRRFEAHLRAIRRACRRPGADGPERWADGSVITLDDGGASGLTAADALERHGLRGHFLVTTNYIGRRGFLDEPGIRELRARGHVIGSHSCSHPLRMGHLCWSQLLSEWTKSRVRLCNVLGEDVCVASVPGGDFTPRVAEAAARAGFRRLFTSEPTLKTYVAFGVTLQGRFTVQRWTTAATAAALAAGAWLPCRRQALLWQVKKLTKCLTGEHYLQIRKLLLRHRDEVRWGDRAERGC